MTTDTEIDDRLRQMNAMHLMVEGIGPVSIAELANLGASVASRYCRNDEAEPSPPKAEPIPPPQAEPTPPPFFDGAITSPTPRKSSASSKISSSKPKPLNSVTLSKPP
jgi:hypothetical protein